MASSNITDPSDWPLTMPELKTIDTLLRCGICYEYYDIAMIIPKCSHNYCSMCIRRYMNYKSQCPTCNTPAEASQLCNNRALDELVSNFKAVRPHILKLCKEDVQKNNGVGPNLVSPPAKLSSEKREEKNKKKSSPGLFKRFWADGDRDFTSDRKSAVGDSETPRRRGQKRPNYRNTREKIASHASDSASSASPERPASPTMQTPHLGSTPSTAAAVSVTLNRSNEENIDPTYQPPPDATEDSDGDAVMATPSGQSLPSTSQGGPSSANNAATPITRSDKVDCPVCGVPIPVKHVNTHLDSCLTKSEDKEARMRVPKRKPLPKIVASVLSDRELRKKLREYGLTAHGNKSIMSKRLQDFTVMYNAQCDSSSPMSMEATVREFTKVEKLKSQSNPTLAVQRLKVSRSQTEEQIAKFQLEYLKSHSSQFHNLIKDTKQRMKTKSKEKVKTTNECKERKLFSCAKSATSAAGSADDGVGKRSGAPKGIASTETTAADESGFDSKSSPSDDSPEVLPGHERETSDSDPIAWVAVAQPNTAIEIIEAIAASPPKRDNDKARPAGSVAVKAVSVAKRVEENSEEQMDVTEDELSPVFGRCSAQSLKRRIVSRQSSETVLEETKANLDIQTAVEDLTKLDADARTSSVPSPPSLLLLNDMDTLSEGSSLVNLETFSEASGSHDNVPSPPDFNCIPESPVPAEERQKHARMGRRKRKPETATEDDGNGGGAGRLTRSRKRGKTTRD